MATPRQKLEIATPEQFEGMTLMRITTSNIKRIRLVDIGITEPLTLIGGDNGNGKTSLLDSVQWVFARKDDIQADPISHGKQEGSIVASFGDGETVKLKVTKTLLRVGADDFKAEIDIEIPGHLTPSRVQEFLAQLTGGIGFDPVAFDQMKDGEQFESLKRFVPDFDFRKNQATYEALFKERTDVNRDLKRMQAAAESVAVADKAPCVREDEEALTKALREAGDTNLDIQRRASNRESARARVEQLRAVALKVTGQIPALRESAGAKYNADLKVIDDQIAQLRARRVELLDGHQKQLEDALGLLVAEAATAATEADKLQSELDAAIPLPDAVNTEALAARIASARANNKIVDEWESARGRKRQYQAEAAELSDSAEELTAQIVDCQQAKQQAILKAHLPVDGLGFGEGFVTLGGVPWQQASHAERIDASTAIAMALNPKLKVILIRDGSNLGTKMRERIRERAQAKGFRVLMEVVDDTGGNSHVFIEDGAVVGLQDKVLA